MDSSTHKTHKSKNRIKDHGEVFTNPREVNAMLDLVIQETQRIESRFLEPACGTGNFLREVLARKMAVVKKNYAKNQTEYEKYSLLSLASIYGIDILIDNVFECRGVLFAQFANEYQKTYKSKIKQNVLDSARHILDKNILWGDALNLKTPDENETPIIFTEWNLIKGSSVKRRDFSLANMLESSPPPDSGEQLGWLVIDDLRPTPIREYDLISITELGTQ